MNIEPVNNARRAWRWYSVQAMTAAAAVQGAWIFIPADLRASIHERWAQGLTALLLLLGIVGRLIDQTPKDKDAQ